MTSPEGGFYATQDADTEGEEGKFYVWTPDEIRAALGGPATRFLALYGVTDEGNFEGKTILTFAGTFEEREAIAGARQALFEVRAQRARPGRDEKVVVSWNGLMLAAFAEAARALDREDYREIAVRNADFLLRELRTPKGRLWHVWKDGAASVSGFLDDYTHLIEGLLALYQTTFEPRWYAAAAELAEAVVAHFAADAGFYDTAGDAETLVVRPREVQDNAVPSGNAMAATVLPQLARLGADKPGSARDYKRLARRSLASMVSMVAQHPLAFGQWLAALDNAMATPVEVAVIGEVDHQDALSLARVAQEAYTPHRLIALGTGDTPPLLAHREQVAGQPTVYVCRATTCRPPVTGVEALKALLD